MDLEGTKLQNPFVTATNGISLGLKSDINRQGFAWGDSKCTNDVKPLLTRYKISAFNFLVKLNIPCDVLGSYDKRGMIESGTQLFP